MRSLIDIINDQAYINYSSIATNNIPLSIRLPLSEAITNVQIGITDELWENNNISIRLPLIRSMYALRKVALVETREKDNR